MDYHKYQLDNGTELYVVQSNLCKTTDIKLGFYSRMDRTEGAKSLVAKLLMEGNKRYPSQQQIQLAADREYASIAGYATSEGDVHKVKFHANVLTKESIVGEQKTLENALGIMSDIISKPRIEDGMFGSECFTRQKQELLLGIKQFQLNKKAMSMQKFTELALGDSGFAYLSSGTEEEVSGLSNKGIVEAYGKMLGFPRKIFASTHLEPGCVYELAKNAFGSLPKASPEIFIGKIPEKKGVGKRVEEASSFDQSMVYVGFPASVPQTMEGRQALSMLNYCLGGYSDSRVFNEIRTKKNMAYYAYSRLNPEGGLLFCYSAVDIKNKEKAIEIMIKETSRASKGKIAKKWFRDAKRYVLNLRMMDSHVADSKVSFLESAVLKNRLEITKHYEDWYKNVSHKEVVESGRLIDASSPIIYCLLQGAGK